MGQEFPEGEATTAVLAAALGRLSFDQARRLTCLIETDYQFHMESVPMSLPHIVTVCILIPSLPKARGANCPVGSNTTWGLGSV